MEQIASLFGNYQLPTKKSSAARAKGTSERGELLVWIAEHVQKPVGQIAFYTKGLKVQDLRYIQSVMTQESKRGTPMWQVFWGSVKPRK